MPRAARLARAFASAPRSRSDPSSRAGADICATCTRLVPAPQNGSSTTSSGTGLGQPGQHGRDHRRRRGGHPLEPAEPGGEEQRADVQDEVAAVVVDVHGPVGRRVHPPEAGLQLVPQWPAAVADVGDAERHRLRVGRGGAEKPAVPGPGQRRHQVRLQPDRAGGEEPDSCELGQRPREVDQQPVPPPLLDPHLRRRPERPQVLDQVVDGTRHRAQQQPVRHGPVWVEGGRGRAR